MDATVRHGTPGPGGFAAPPGSLSLRTVADRFAYAGFRVAGVGGGLVSRGTNGSRRRDFDFRLFRLDLPFDLPSPEILSLSAGDSPNPAPSLSPSVSAGPGAAVPSSLPDALRAIIHEHPVPIGPHRYDLLFVNDIDALLDSLADDADVPYWSVLWESAIALSGWLVENPDVVSGRDVLELGAGLGLCGMVARQLGGRVVQTDNHQPSLDLSAENARRNGIDVPAQFLGDWREWTHDTLYDVILGSDIVYERPVHDILLRIFRRNLRPGGLLLLSEPFRESGWEMLERLDNEGWTVEMQSRHVAWERKTREILLLRARRAL